MQEEVITIYCLCADFLSAWGVVDDTQSRMTTAEVMTVALVAAALFRGEHEKSRIFLREFGFIPPERMLSKGRFNRRLHAIDEALWQALFRILADVHKAANDGQEYVVDSMPAPVCDEYRIIRCRIYPLKESNARPAGEGYRGRIACKRRYFYGVRVHLVITATGRPVECVLAPGATADMRVLQHMQLDLPEGAHLFADPGYADYVQEDLMQEAGLHLIAARKSRSKRPHPGWVEYICDQTRKRVETTFSLISDMFARSIHAVTARGFELKVFLTVLAYSITA